MRGVKRACARWEHRQAAVVSRDASLNVYAEHLSGLQRILKRAAEDIRDLAGET
jgi:hypothetical protein